MARKGQTGSTAGRKAETLRSPSTGETIRVYFGQRLLVVNKSAGKTWLTAWITKEDAQDHRDRVGGSAYIERAEVVS